LKHNGELVGKDSWDEETTNATIAWLYNQTYYQEYIRVYKNALFGYEDPTTNSLQLCDGLLARVLDQSGQLA
jgi:hypothetical protein